MKKPKIYTEKERMMKKIIKIVLLVIFLFVCTIPMNAGSAKAVTYNAPVNDAIEDSTHIRYLTYSQFVNLIAKAKNISNVESAKLIAKDSVFSPSEKGTHRGVIEYGIVYGRENFGTCNKPVVVGLGVPAILYVNGGIRYFKKLYMEGAYTKITSSDSVTWDEMYAVAYEPNSVTVVLNARGVAAEVISDTKSNPASENMPESVKSTAPIPANTAVYLRKVCQFDTHTYCLYPGL